MENEPPIELPAEIERSEEHTSELQSQSNLVCRLLLEKKKRLVHTKITDATVHSLSRLDQLESLNIFGTRTTPAVLHIVAVLPKLRHLYSGETTIRAAAPLPAALKDKVLF